MIPEPDEDRPDESWPSMALPPGTLISHYRVIDKIGAGGMGVVYRAEDTRLKRVVALKFLPPRLLFDAEARTRFALEAQSASGLSHANITTIYEFDEVDGRCFIAMEYIDGLSLTQFVREHDHSMDEILEVAIQISEGLNAAHEKGIVHRDIKPANIMLTSKGRVKIMDFGLAKLGGVSKLTSAGTTLGTVHYMSPEQVKGQELDRRSDIFSLGVLLYEMITGHLPFRGKYNQAVFYSILNDTPEPLARYKADVPDGLQRIIDKALAKDREERYQHADELVADLLRERHASEQTGSAFAAIGHTEERSKWRFLRILGPVVAACIITLFIFVFEPFRIGLGPEKEAVARENSLAIMYFENLADRDDPERLGEIVANLLITDLSESRYMSVVSSQRLYDVLNLLGQKGLKAIDKRVASEVATKAGAKWMLLGSILRVKPQIVITTQLVNVKTGQVEASERITSEPGEDVFRLVDKLSVRIKTDLSLPSGAQKERDRPVADVTTDSPEAYLHYLEALDYSSKYYWREAQRSYEKALEFDSTFAMAYYGLAATQWELGLGGQQESIARAVEYSEDVSWKERQFIRSLDAKISGDCARAARELIEVLERYPEEKEAFWELGLLYDTRLNQPDEAITCYSKVIEIDPLNSMAYNGLAYCYDRIGDFGSAISAVNQYISLAPDEPNPYDSKGDLYAWNGKIEEAIESYAQALETDPTFTWSRTKLGHMYLLQRDYDKAETCYRELLASGDKKDRSIGRTCLALIPLYRGRFDEALEVLDHGLAADRMEQAEGRPGITKHACKAEIYRQRGDSDSALREWEKGMAIHSSVYPDYLDNHRAYYVLLLLQSGQYARAEEEAMALKKDIDQQHHAKINWYWYAEGCIQAARGDYEEGLTNLEKAVEGDAAFWVRYTLAATYLESGRLAEAVTEFEKVLSTFEERRAFWGIKAALAYYYLGLAYERSGCSNKAAEQYQEFLEIWRDADPGMVELEDARRRLVRLKSST